VNAVLAGLGTAEAPHPVAQDEARRFAQATVVRSRPALARMLDVFDRAGIERRTLAAPLAFLEAAPSFAARNDRFAACAPALAAAAARSALDDATVPPADVRGVVLTCSTGLAAPNLDRNLVFDLGLDPGVRRAPLWGLGCAGGVAATALAADLAVALDGPVLAVAIETCSLAFVPSDPSRANLVACALFGDGAAAAVLAPSGDGPTVTAHRSHLVPDTVEAMGWDVVDAGLKVRFAPTLPGIVARHVGPATAALARAAGLARFDRFALHPGGPKILDAYAEALRPPADDLAAARAVLHRHGNMSSPTALFVLDRLRRATPPAAGQTLAMLALGPGLAVEGLVLRW